MSEKSNVFFAPFKPSVSRLARLTAVLDKLDVKNSVHAGDLTAIKLHFGEEGNDTFMRPTFARAIVDAVKAAGGNPFLTDSNTLYTGSRRNSVDHLLTAIHHGFGYEVTGAPLIIADGLKSTDYQEVKINGDFFKSVKISSAIREADALIVLSHFKGHEAAGFGGAIKNLGMGCAPAAGKKDQHASRLIVDQENCIGCGRCNNVCPSGAAQLSNVSGKRKSTIDTRVCIGCCQCMTVCPKHAIGVDWNFSNLADFNCRLSEYAYGAIKDKQRPLFINVLMDITPLCDCCGWSDAPIVPDIGIVGSTDPVAVDAASFALVTAAQGLKSEGYTNSLKAGDNKFCTAFPNTHPEVQLQHGAKIGMGSEQYELIRV